jgi:uncharacterized membrane-anchored protein
MDYDAILKKMNLYYFEGKLQNQPQNQQNQPQNQHQLTREEFIQLRKRQMNEKKRIQHEQFQKRKLLLSTNITTTSRLKQMNISKFI